MYQRAHVYRCEYHLVFYGGYSCTVLFYDAAAEGEIVGGR
jgi:hypothetical protein